MSANRDKAARKLAQCVRQLINASAFAEVIAAVESGVLTAKSGSATIAKLSAGRGEVQNALTWLIAIWASELAVLSNSAFALHLAALKEAVLLTESEATQTEVVWTGPKVEGSYLRATRQVVQDIISAAKSELLVVGYWLAGKEDYEGIINDIIKLMADAVSRGVEVTMVLDQGEKSYGKNNRDTLIALWPQDIALPKLLTWRIPPDDKHLKLHAKVLVADHHDSLVTSANLTMYALDRNMEMGVRAQGQPSERIAQHFELLRHKEVLVPYDT
ncbi:DISARM system phospholipase D-like protein DrmC [Photobacterium sp. ZSDE20]|uniref:DISARM system phospholipase D-like protein DrmC n=1 Tax=Photobacterium pectinilyticum TaxID=2906793 RepID=A0ABT1N809_9GAMM|nr:DISARM system phospholipase D-like protein DrmC [Photobacterium sp. ZSDE20]MCQ1059969.1 DISARM system phospholipase D-like protein DrmC [Photobacterium sp. ZSDE20]MDD1826807.1 DISARM system phospholipase D-like protein DrmC [Photobacterium sp. ZSDE20]